MLWQMNESMGSTLTGRPTASGFASVQAPKDFSNLASVFRWRWPRQCVTNLHILATILALGVVRYFLSNRYARGIRVVEGIGPISLGDWVASLFGCVWSACGQKSQPTRKLRFQADLETKSARRAILTGTTGQGSEVDTTYSGYAEFQDALSGVVSTEIAMVPESSCLELRSQDFLVSTPSARGGCFEGTIFATSRKCAAPTNCGPGLQREKPTLSALSHDMSNRQLVLGGTWFSYNAIT
jgi:hypothetical protein